MSTQVLNKGFREPFAWLSRRPEIVPFVLCALLFNLDIRHGKYDLRNILPTTVHVVGTTMSFEGQDDDFYVTTYLPETDERQSVLSLEVESGNLALSYQNEGSNLLARWTSTSASERVSAGYVSQIAARGVRYTINPDIALPRAVSASQAQFLKETPAIQVHHPEILALGRQILPAENDKLLDTLQAIHAYITHDIEGAEFKGYTDALTALRLQQASCNGKARLFAALTRQVGLPTRLVGGIILNDGEKKTSHQWVEVLIAGKWVPFDPTNDYFAEIPANYLSLYKGDEALFTHTRNINFDYLFKIDSFRVSSHQLDPEGSQSWLVAMFSRMDFDLDLAGTFLLFPVAALVITICRNIVGLRSFGIFLPILIAAVCAHSGFLLGIGGFLLVFGLASLMRMIMGGLRLLQVPRLSALITIVTSMIILIIWFIEERVDLGVTALILLPVIILSFSAERMSDVIENSSLFEGVKMVVSTLFLVSACYLVLGSKLLEGIFLNFPELLLLVLGLQLMIGRWSGLRVSEYIRFRKLRGSRQPLDGQVLGINRRNRRLVDAINKPQDIATANNKVLTKGILSNHGIPVPQTLSVIEGYWDLKSFEDRVGQWNSFVVKPCMGSQGKGILVVQGRDGIDFLLAGGDRLTPEQLRHHLEEILAGVYTSAADEDTILVEAVIQPTTFYRGLCTEGLPDIRVILVDGEVLAAMLRVPTNQSDGKANLHQGAIGIPVELSTGLTGQGYLEGRPVPLHPDSGIALEGLQVPNWDLVLEIATATQSAIKLGYVGVDIADDISTGPVVIEVNARPGLEIQNVHGFGFGNLVETLLEKAAGKSSVQVAT